MNESNEFSALSIIQSTEPKALAESMAVIRQYQALIKNTLVEGHDYGVIPGTGNKPTLLKPGGEKVCLMFKLNPEYEIMDQTEDYDKGFFTYSFRCTIFKTVVQDGVVLKFPISQGVGNCNSKEEKYRYVSYYESELPQGIDKSQLRQKRDKKGNVKYRMENQEVYSIVNTILKMAKKRAFIDACLQVVSLSELFTQDLDDYANRDSYDSAEPQEQPRTPTPAPASTGASTGSRDPGAVILNFGNKHSTKSIREVAQDDSSYLDWVVNKSNASDSIKNNIRSYYASLKIAPKPATPVARDVTPPAEDDDGYAPPIDDSDLPFSTN